MPDTSLVKPLKGIKVLEFDAIGPVPFCGMMLMDHGASILRLGRPGAQPNGSNLDQSDPMLRGRPTGTLDLKAPESTQRVLELVAQADVLIEGHRAGVMERLGLGPEVCAKRNPRLIYGRGSGFGQSGPLALAPGHDINYLALSGVLHGCGEPDRPPRPPLNLLADFGGGGMLLAFGVVTALLAARASGRGSVVDAAMCDGAALLSTSIRGLYNTGQWTDARGENILDGGAPFYGVYETRDGKYIAIGALEPKFYAALRCALGLHDTLFDEQMNRNRWPAMRAAIAQIVRQRTRDEWVRSWEGTDACISPVLDWQEAPRHPHHQARGTFRRLSSVEQKQVPAPAPRITALSDVANDPSCDRQGDSGLEQVLAPWNLPPEMERYFRSLISPG